MKKGFKSHWSISIFSILILLTSIEICIPATIQLPRTGQTECWNWQEPFEKIPCVGTGQDGEYQAGVPLPTFRFVIDGDCITDTLTGLMWARNGNLPNNKMTWNPAIDFANDLVLCGHDDWRLPNINELESLLNISGDEPDTSAWLMTQGFTNVQSSNYWSSTTNLHLEDEHAWIIDMHWGNISSVIKESTTDFCYVLPVRGNTTPPAEVWKTGQTISHRPGDDGDLQRGVAWPNPRFTDQLNGTVIDNLTGLIWTKDANPIGGYSTWKEALDFANGMGWRLPNRKELMSLIDWSQSGGSVALPPAHPFVNVQSCCHWTSTSRENSSERADTAWFIFMGLGNISPDYKPYDHLYAWPVRGGTIYSRLNVIKSGSGVGTVISNPSGIDCGSTCASQSASFVPDTLVILTTIPGNNSAFAYWSGACSGSSPTCEITMTSYVEVTAHFVSDETKEYKLKVKRAKKNGGDGTVKSNDGNIECGGACTHTYYKDTVVTLSAVANDTSTFLGWKPDKLNCIGTGSCMVTMDKARTVQAVFVGDYRLKVVNQSKKGGTGTVTSNPSGISCQTGNSTGCQATYPYAEQVTLLASADSGSTFLGWNPAKLCPGTGDCIVMMGSKRTIKALFLGQ